MKGKLDMTQGVGWRHVLVFSLPIMLGNLLQQLYNTVDGIVVGKYVSEAALGAVGNCASLTFLFIAIAVGLSNGASIVVAQFFGAKREDDLRRAAATAIVLLGGVGIGGVVFGMACSKWLLGTVLGIKDAEVLGKPSPISPFTRQVFCSSFCTTLSLRFCALWATARPPCIFFLFLR